MEHTNENGLQNTNTRLLAIITVIVLGIVLGSAGVAFFGSRNTATSPSHSQPTPPSSIRITKVTKINELPDTHYYMDNAQLAEYNKANQQLITKATNQFASRVGGPSAQQIEALDLLKADMQADFMSAQQVATRLQAIMPEIDIVQVYNTLDTSIISIFEAPNAMVYPIIQ